MREAVLELRTMRSSYVFRVEMHDDPCSDLVSMLISIASSITAAHIINGLLLALT